MRYAWIITRDYDYERAAQEDDPSLLDPSTVGLTGPSRATPDEIERARTEGRRFRLVLDEPTDEVTCEGLLWTEAGPGTEADFGPLEDWGYGGIGAVAIQFYSEDDQEWQTL